MLMTPHSQHTVYPIARYSYNNGSKTMEYTPQIQKFSKKLGATSKIPGARRVKRSKFHA
jgi:hypothetical protein